MKKIYVIILCCFGTAPSFSQTLFTYGNYAVSKDDFLKAYNKNKMPVVNTDSSLKEYLDLYSKFKLKVKTAELQRLDTLQELQNDLQNFRSQVEESYMNDEKGLNTLIDEAINRGQKDIHVQHFYIPLDASMKATDTLNIYKMMKELAAELTKPTIKISETISLVNTKYPSVKSKDLGYITALTLPYDIENLVYGLKPGEVSRLFRTKSALHIFKNAEERRTAGKWKVAQILIAIPPDATADQLKPIQKKADSIYLLLSNGADFKELAKEVSEDKLTYMNGGEMPEFGTGKFDVDFESKVFELKKDGDITRPILTEYGYHIVNRLNRQAIPADKSDEAFVASLKQQILKDSRINTAKAIFLKDIKIKTGFKRNNTIRDSELFKYADSVSANAIVGKYPINSKTIFSFTKLNVKGADWLNFVKDYKLNKDVYKGENNKELLEKYIETATHEYYRKHLEEYSNEFKYQMQEFKEGNMLFEIMERNVWSKAANDSIGLKKYYNDHRPGYLWAESATVLLFNCSDDKMATMAIADLKKGKDWKLIAEESDGTIQSDSGRYELAQIPIPEGLAVTEGLITPPLSNSGDNTTSFAKVIKIFPAQQQRSFEEARGLVINEYQAYLEEKWMEDLKKKYPIKVNEAVFQSLLK